MQIICVSRGTYEKGQALAESLGAKMGHSCLSRQELVEAAILRGIPVVKLEAAMRRPHVYSERLALVKEHYQAFGAAYLLERAKQGGLVYHGRCGQLLLPGISHLFRIRVVAGRAYRVDNGHTRRYDQDLHEEVGRWVKLFYNVDWEMAFHYDVTVNLDQMSVENASTALCAMAQLPEFQPTPVSMKARENLRLASWARLALAEHPNTAKAQFKVRADDGIVTVTYLPQQMIDPTQVIEVLEEVEGVRQAICTKARTNILWIQERFDPASDMFHDVVSLAQKWDAAVELRRFVAVGADVVEVVGSHGAAASSINASRISDQTREDGQTIEDDELEEETLAGAKARSDDGGMRRTLAELVNLGRSAGGISLRASPRRLVESINLTINYSLVIVGDVFLRKERAAQKRLTRELGGSLNDRLSRPVVTAEELRQQFLFSAKDLVKLAVFAVLAAAIYILAFAHQSPILQFLHPQNEAGEATRTARILAAVGVFLFVPLITYLYGTASRLFLKLLRIE